MSDYHVFKRDVVGPKGKTVRRWYYWWTDELGKQRQKVCKKCETKAEAEAFVLTLPVLRRNVEFSIGRIAKNMFVPGSDHYNRRVQFGHSVKPILLDESRFYIDTIVENWGSIDIRDLTVQHVHGLLLKDKRSGSWKNRLLEILGEIYQEAPWYGCTVSKPVFPRFARNSKKADVLTSEEIQAFLHLDLFGPASEPSTEMFFVLFLMALSCGLRISEARAIRSSQLILSEILDPTINQKVLTYSLVVDGFLDRGKDPKRNSYTKKGSDESPRLRVVLVSELTAKIFMAYVKRQRRSPDDLVFQYDNRAVYLRHADEVFARAITKMRTRLKDTDTSRKLVPHSLRYTYITRLRAKLTGDEVRKLAGHSSIEQTDAYTRAAIPETIAGMLDIKPAVDSFFTFAPPLVVTPEGA